MTGSFPFTQLFEEDDVCFFPNTLGLLEGFLTAGFDVTGGFFVEDDCWTGIMFSFFFGSTFLASTFLGVASEFDVELGTRDLAFLRSCLLVDS